MEDEIRLGPAYGKLIAQLIGCGAFVAVGVALVVLGVMAGLPRSAGAVVLGAVIALLFGLSGAHMAVRTIRQGPALVLTPAGVRSSGWFLPWDQIATIGTVESSFSMRPSFVRPKVRFVGVRLIDPRILREQDPEERLEADRRSGHGYDITWPASTLPGSGHGIVEQMTEYGIRHGLRVDPST